MTKRLFIATKITPGRSFLEHLDGFKKALSHERIKWVETHNIHITYQFLGETEANRIPIIEKQLGLVSCNYDPLQIRLKDFGIFGSRYQPRVIWAGIDPFHELKMVMKSVHQSMESVGFTPDRQNLVPHLTLGRIRKLRDSAFFREQLDKYRIFTSSEINIREICLFESILRKEGPQYTVLRRYLIKIHP